MKNILISFLCACSLAACSHPQGITSWGYDGYTLSVPAPAPGEEEGTRKLALMDAEKYCRDMNKEMMFLSADTDQSLMNIRFRCPTNRFPNY